MHLSRCMAATRSATLVETDPKPPAGPVTSGDSKPNGHGVRTAALVGLLILGIFYTFIFARAFFLPLFFAVLFDLLLTPVVRLLARVRIPVPVGAGIVILLLLGGIGLGVYQLGGQAQEWAREAPQKISKARDKLRGVMRPVEQMKKTAEQMQQATEPATGAKPAPQPVTVQQNSSVLSRLFGTTQAFLVGLFEMVILLYFLLASGSLFTEKIIKVIPRVRDQKKALQITHEVEASISRYLSTVALINVIEGLVIAIVMKLIGVPSPWLWGALCAVLIFIPYIGAVTMIVVLFIASITTFDSLGKALVAPGAFFLIDVVQANLVAPHILGRRMMLNPVAIFISILLWGEVWGVAGVFMAVPIAVVLKIFCDHVDALAPVGEFLGK
jgi:predicted PurR-regulated permease PerM